MNTPKKHAKKAKTPVAKGWECPRCTKIHAPDVMGCDCEKKQPDYGEKEQIQWKLIKEFHERCKEANKLRPEPPPMTWPFAPQFEPYYPGPIWVIPQYHTPYRGLGVTCHSDGMCQGMVR